MGMRVFVADDVEAYILKLSKTRDVSLDEIVNEIVRKEMGVEKPPAKDTGKRKPFKVVPFTSGLRPEITDENLKEVVAEIEIEEMMRKIEQ